MDAAGSAADVVVVVAAHGRPAAQEILAAMEERMYKTTERIESHVAMMQARIHRFPRGLRGIGGEDGRYIVPSVVAIGPYHHGLPHLQEMEEVKHAAAHRFCRDAGRPTEEVYERILSLTSDARHFYAPDDGAVARLGDAELAAMLFLDGCFLLQYMGKSDDEPMFAGCNLSSGQAILKDMMLLENQIPWLVLDALTEFLPLDVRQFVADVGEKFFPKEKVTGWMWIRRFQMFLTKRRRRCVPAKTESRGQSTISYRPAHLLGLLRFSQIQSMPGNERAYQAGSSSLLSSSAVELAQIGVKLSASTATWLGDMSLGKKLVLGELCLSPLFLNDVTACWLVNMAALEARTAWDSDGFVVSSYLSVVAMLMDRKEDVHELRSKGVLRSLFSNTQTLAFFKGLGQHLRLGGRYVVVLEQIESYKRNRPVRIAVHRFLYKNYKIIAAVLSIAGVIIGIFKALLALKTG
ncbi:hypothetical protein GQ55_4G281200 [Panicum hallii var. hallii]|uniref:Uncharacterized protein n=1 Tax=Panicum hallii var. hallii TaxID=1504633 RepID=A0A2T7E0Y3_9POAL|nr:hypothetical protein GQ55_4G281200 [Panicum hallii var. hallii]